MPHVLGDYEDLTKRNVTWEQIAEHSEIVLAFGGMALKNSMVAGGSISQHVERGAMRARAGTRLRVRAVSPLRERSAGRSRRRVDQQHPRHRHRADAGAGAHAGRRRAARPRLPRPLHASAGRCSSAIFWARPTASRRTPPGPPPSPASPPTTIVALARRLHGRRALIVVSHSLQRAEHGEQPVWMGAVLAAVLGQIGLPGGGFAYALGAIAYYGTPLQCGAAADAAAGPQRRRRLHPGRPHRRHAAQSRRAPIATTARP